MIKFIKRASFMVSTNNWDEEPHHARLRWRHPMWLAGRRQLRHNTSARGSLAASSSQSSRWSQSSGRRSGGNGAAARAAASSPPPWLLSRFWVLRPLLLLLLRTLKLLSATTPAKFKADACAFGPRSRLEDIGGRVQPHAVLFFFSSTVLKWKIRMKFDGWIIENTWRLDEQLSDCICN